MWTEVSMDFTVYFTAFQTGVTEDPIILVLCQSSQPCFHPHKGSACIQQLHLTAP